MALYLRSGIRSGDIGHRFRKPIIAHHLIRRFKLVRMRFFGMHV
jgi:hypothetical protein